MSAVLGIDLSTKAIDLVKLDETTNDATWTRINLEGKTALDRLREVRPKLMPIPLPEWTEWLEDVYLIAIEAPMSRDQYGTLAKLSRVFGAIVASMPNSVELWEVSPPLWRKGLGIPGNAKKEVCAEAVIRIGCGGALDHPIWEWPQDAHDAYAVAYYTRELNALGISLSEASEKQLVLL